MLLIWTKSKNGALPGGGTDGKTLTPEFLADHFGLDSSPGCV
jgi:hypothetical protein